jgi:eukaryotic-like serine/threonine-protein kinase
MRSRPRTNGISRIANETFGQFSPNGKWVTYDSDESGRREVYVQGFAPDKSPAASVGKWTISSSGGSKPSWSRDGSELFYVARDGKMMAVPVKSTATTFEPETPVALFQTKLTGFFPYDVAADGRFLINTVNPEKQTKACRLPWSSTGACC